jgi:hypothetical protein
MPRYVVQNTPHTSCPNAWKVLDTKLGKPATANDRPQIHLTLDEALDMSAELNYADRERRTAALH